MKRLVFVLMILPVQLAADSSDAGRLLELMRFDQLAEVSREEGISGNASVLEDFGLTSNEAFWLEELDVIFDEGKTEEMFRTSFAKAYNQRSIVDAIAFLGSEAWMRAYDLQIDTSLLLTDPALEEAAVIHYWEHIENNSPRVPLIEDLVASTDLVEQNIAGAMNAMLAFNRGMTFVSSDLGYPDEEMIALLYASETELRLEISEWLHAYYLVAYLPLTEADISQQIEFWTSQAGQDISAAMMLSYDVVHNDQSFAVGRALAEILNSPAL